MFQLIAQGNQPVALKVQPRLEPSELEGTGEGNRRVSPQLPRILHDGGFTLRRDAKR